MRTEQKTKPETQPAADRRGGANARRMLLAAGGLAVVLGVALSGVGGSYALWNDSAVVDAGSISTGTPGFEAQWAAGHDDALWQNLLPEESRRQQFTVTNTGDVPMALSASAIAAPGFEVRILGRSCPTTAFATSALIGTPTALLAAAGDTEPVSIAAGAALSGCLEVRVAADAMPASGSTFSITIDGRQTP